MSTEQVTKDDCFIQVYRDLDKDDPVVYQSFIEDYGDSPVVINHSGDRYDLIGVEEIGGEGQGDTLQVIFRVEKNGKPFGHYIVTGSWISYHGSEFYNYDPTLVEKKEVVKEEWVQV